MKLAFVLYTNDAHFFDYSELPYDTPGEYVYYFNNLDENKRNTMLLLQVDGVSKEERVRIHTKKIEYLLDSNAKSRVLDCYGKMIPETEYDYQIDHINKKCIIDLTRKGDGFYIVEYGNESSAFYCVPASFIRKIPLAIIELFVNPSVPKMYQIVNRMNGKQYIDSKKFRLHFGIFTVYWRYKIIPRNIHQSICIKVKVSGDKYQFTPDRVRIGCSQEPIIFTSTQMINKENDIVVSLYKVTFHSHDKCNWKKKYYYCGKMYGFYKKSKFVCRRSHLKDGKKIFKYNCPVKCHEHLIGTLPKPDEIHTRYYYENDKYFAEMSLYLIHKNCELIISETEDLS